jgi:hypothetical protein
MLPNNLYTIVMLVLMASCQKSKSSAPPPAPVPTSISVQDVQVSGASLVNGIPKYGVAVNAAVKIKCNNAVQKSSVPASVTLAVAATASVVNVNISYENGDSTIVLQPQAPLQYLTRYQVSVSRALQSASGGSHGDFVTRQWVTAVDPSPKFPALSDAALLDKVQQQTFKYFWDYGHPVSGLARERSNEAPETVTSGGSGFGIMCVVNGIHRGFITRAQGLQRMQTIVSFLKNTAQKFHGAFPHWLNGTTGAVIPFSPNDNGADLVETSYLVMGLLTARQYFNGVDAAETGLRNDINTICNAVEWNWFRKNNENVLYWHWSPNLNWVMNMPIRGWNECLITYILAASSTTYGVPASVYQNGWTASGANGFTSGNTYYGYTLPLGPNLGGPLFFEQYTFMGVNPNGLNDAYANYATQAKNHTLINYEYCKSNPRQYYGYSDSCWGLTASDIPNGYTASSPTNDVGVIAPTAAVSSFPFTPTESMKALKYFYYTLGDKIWGEYGFRDAFSLKDTWFANSFLAIDQGPMMVMIENYRSGLFWNLFTSCPEVKNGMRLLGFTAPYL